MYTNHLHDNTSSSSKFQCHIPSNHAESQNQTVPCEADEGARKLQLVHEIKATGATKLYVHAHAMKSFLFLVTSLPKVKNLKPFPVGLLHDLNR